MRCPGPLQAIDLEVTYVDRVALRAVSLSLEPGQSLAITGPAGSGKTTVLWALAGATPHAGQVLLAGEPVTDRVSAAGRGIAVVPQGNGLASSLTASENVLLPAIGNGVDVAEATRRTRQSLDDVGLGDSGGHLIEELSGGQQQRVAVARALAQDPVVLLADEPTSDLDSTTRARVVAALLDRARAGAIVVISTNDPDVAESFDRQADLDEGILTWR